MILLWSVFVFGYVCGFLITCAVGSWLLWEVKSYTPAQGGERTWAVPDKDDLFMLALVASFFWWVFVLPLLGYAVLRNTIKYKNNVGRKEIELLEFQALQQADQKKEMDHLHAQNQHRQLGDHHHSELTLP